MLSNLTRNAATGLNLNISITPPASAGFLVKSGTSLLASGSTWRGAGFNWHWAALRESNLQYPTTTMQDEVMDAAVDMGATVMRVHTLGISAGLSNQLVTGINADASLVWNNAAWQPIDYVVAGARQRGLRLWIPFTDQYYYYHLGKGWWVQQAFLQQGTSNIPSSYSDPNSSTTWNNIHSFDPTSGSPASNQQYKIIAQQFYRNGWIQTAFIDNYLKGWLDHVNQYTGIANKDEPMIAFLAAGNELWDSGDAYPDHAGADGLTWQARFSAAVKSKTNALVVDPSGSSGVDLYHAPGRGDANTDVFDYHPYTQGPDMANGLAAQYAAIAANFNKVMTFGEYSFNELGSSDFLSSVESTAGLAFANFWAVYSTSEGHSSSTADDSVYVIGQNAGWKSQFQTHASVMSSGTVPAPPPPPTNILQSNSVANSDAAASYYASGSADNSDPVLSMESNTGVSGGALLATTAGNGHKWVYVNMNSSVAAPVTAGSTYTASAHVKIASGTPATGAQAHLSWFNSGGSYISGTTAASYTSLSSSNYAQVTWTATAPAGAAYAVPQIEFDGPAAGSCSLRIDQWGIFAGSSAYPWSAP